MSQKPKEIRSAEGKLGVLLPGMGAVATTFVAGVMAVRRGQGQPIGSLTQMGTIRLGKRTDDRSPSSASHSIPRRRFTASASTSSGSTRSARRSTS